MATIERKPLPPPNSKVTAITEADRADIIARANEVIDHYLNGPGSYFDSGTRKPLVGEYGNNTVADLNNFKDSIIASMQFADDPQSNMQSVVDLIDQAVRQVKEVAQDKEGRDSILLPLPDTNDPIRIPKINGGSTLPVSLPTEEGVQPTSPQQAESNPVRRLVRLNGGTSPAMDVSDHQSSWSRFRNGISSPLGIPPRNPNLPVPPPETEGPLGIVSGNPMRFFQLPIFDTRTNSGASDKWFTASLLGNSRASQPSSLDANAPQVRFAANRQDWLSSGNAATPVAGGSSDAFCSADIAAPGF
jgi:hypothetical protein